MYCSNESNTDVFFDNLQLIHTRGPLSETADYYSLGLQMAGIGSKSASKLEANKRFQKQEFAHKEFSDGSGLETYEFKYRMDDPQTGRFWQIDPLADKYTYNSTYAFSENKVTGHVELEGLESVPTVGTRGIDGRYPVQGDYDGDGVVNKQERESWSAAMLSWIDIGSKTYLMGAAPNVGFPLVASDLSGVPVTPSPQAMSTTSIALTEDIVDDAKLLGGEREITNSHGN